MKKETIREITDSYLNIIFKQETKIKQQAETINKLSDMSNKHRRSVEILESRLNKTNSVGSLLSKLPAFILQTDNDLLYYLSIRNSKEGFEIGYVNNQGEFLFEPQYDNDFLKCLEKAVKSYIDYA